MADNKHYKGRKVETIEKMELMADLCSDYLNSVQVGCVYMATKYIDRMGEKDGEPAEKDAAKARDYLVRAMKDVRWPWEYAEDVEHRAKVAGKQVGTAAMFEALAEEAAELAHASLKVARRMRKENPTPESLDQALRNTAEEFSDVALCALALELRPDEKVMEKKLERWEQRLEVKRAEERR